MADPLFNELSATTKVDIRNAVVWNNYWVDTPLQDHLRRNGAVDPFLGGSSMQEPILYGGPDGGAINPGQTVTVTRKQIVAAFQFMPKAYASWFSYDDFEMAPDEGGVMNSGEPAAVDLYQVYVEGLTSRLNTLNELDFFRHGQASATNGGGAGVADDRSLAINGAAEACNDGFTPSWDGNIFTNSGAQVRNGAVQNTINSIPYFFGNPDGSAGQISFEGMLEMYQGSFERPDIGVTSKIGYTYIAALYQRQQRYDTSITKGDGIRWKGLQFEDAIIYDDWLTPSAVDPGYLPTSLVGSVGGQPNLTGSFHSPANPSPASHLPASTNITVGETLWFLHGASWKMRATNKKAWFFGIRETQAYDNVSMNAIYMKWAGNIYSPIPRNNRQGYGFTS